MPSVVAVAASAAHAFSKPTRPRIRLIEGFGVEGDAHGGATVKHRSRVAVDPTQPNLRQVHLIHMELIESLRARGFHVFPGAMGENVTTRGVDLLGLSRGTLLRLGPEAIVEITGLRNPCKQLDGFQDGLMQAVLGRAPDGRPVRLAGVMGVVRAGGEVAPGDPIAVEPPPGSFVALDRV